MTNQFGHTKPGLDVLFMIPLHFCMMWSCLKLFEMSGRDRRNKLSLSQNHSAPQLHSILYSIQKIPNATSHLGSFKERPFDSSPGSCQLRLKRCLCSTARRWRADHVGSCCVWRFLVSYPSCQLIFTGSPVLTRCGSTRAMVTLVKSQNWCHLTLCVWTSHYRIEL